MEDGNPVTIEQLKNGPRRYHAYELGLESLPPIFYLSIDGIRYRFRVLSEIKAQTAVDTEKFIHQYMEMDDSCEEPFITKLFCGGVTSTILVSDVRYLPEIIPEHVLYLARTSLDSSGEIAYKPMALRKLYPKVVPKWNMLEDLDEWIAARTRDPNWIIPSEFILLRSFLIYVLQGFPRSSLS